MKLPVLTVLLACSILPSVSHALVRELASCRTQDGAFSIMVTDNQGIGFPRESHIGAMIRNSSGAPIATYEAKERHTRSQSFGREQYVDVATEGDLFVLEGPSTNDRNYNFKAIINGVAVTGQALNCSVFGGILVN